MLNKKYNCMCREPKPTKSVKCQPGTFISWHSFAKIDADSLLCGSGWINNNKKEGTFEDQMTAEWGLTLHRSAAQSHNTINKVHDDTEANLI